VGRSSYLGTKLIDCRDVSLYYGDRCFLKDFSYKFQRYEKVGIVGRNGVGKTTFINLLMGRLEGDAAVTGSIERGESLNIGLYRQSGMAFDENQTVLETVNDTHLLNRFLFPHDMLNNRISKLSGGEKRRLYLLTVLMRNPNLLVLDEPTNDLDIVTLNILEEYLKEWKGTLVIVSHDRHFLDRLVDHLFIFCGDGVVKDFVGSYSQYRDYIKEYEAGQKAKEKESERSRRTESSGSAPESSRPSSVPRKLSYKEQRELGQLEKDIASLTAEKAELESAMNGGITDHDRLQQISTRFSEVSSLLDEKETRWLELSL
ncbi:MAG: ATP-binding cassette domain-containing protein, partial [Candidatus Cryptobacteroides sp.]